MPYLGQAGEYWGAPENDAAAIREFEALRQTGARFMAFAAPAFWWLDYYSGLGHHLRENFHCLLESNHWIVYDLREQRRPLGP
jgi:hypothetical protein